LHLAESEKAQAEPQQLPGIQPSVDGLPPQHVEWFGVAGPRLLIEKADADMILSSRDPPHEPQTSASEFRPIPTRRSLTWLQSEHLYS
jgi:hypothetical protein